MASTMHHHPPSSGHIVIETSDHGSVKVDKELLCRGSGVFGDLLSACDTGSIKVDETRAELVLLVEALRGSPVAATFDTRSSACWSDYKKIFLLADKYDCPLVRERCEKWLVSRCLRGRVRCSDFKFQDLEMGSEWLGLCQKYGLRDLGWYCAYDLGCQLAEGQWTLPVGELLKDTSDPEMLKTMLEAVADTVAAAGAGAGPSLSGPPLSAAHSTDNEAP